MNILTIYSHCFICFLYFLKDKTVQIRVFTPICVCRKTLSFVLILKVRMSVVCSKYLFCSSRLLALSYVASLYVTSTPRRIIISGNTNRPLPQFSEANRLYAIHSFISNFVYFDFLLFPSLQICVNLSPWEVQSNLYS